MHLEWSRKCLKVTRVENVYSRLQRRCLCEWSVSLQLYCWGGVCVSDLCRRIYIGVCRGGVCVSDLSPQFFGRFQRRCLSEWPVSPQFYWRLQRRCLCELPAAPHLYWRLQNVVQQCQVRMPYKSVQKACQVRVSFKSGKYVRASNKSVK